MTFRDQRLSILISDGATGGGGFPDSDIAVNDGGYESRNSNGSLNLGRWDVSYAARLESIWVPLQDHHYCVGHGQLYTFPFQDRADYICTSAQSYLAPADDDSPPTSWQMYKRRTSGAYTFDQIIQLPIVAKTVVAGGGSYSVGRLTGIITKLSGANPTGFSCEFDKPCRYGIDRMRYSQITHKPDGTLLIGWLAIPIIQVPTVEPV